MDKYTEEELDRIRTAWRNSAFVDVDNLRVQRNHLGAASQVDRKALEEADPEMAKIVEELTDYISQRPHPDLNNPDVA